MKDICKNCGGSDGIHHYQTNQCPVGGCEAPIGKRQEWQSTTFQADDSDELEELRKTVSKLKDKISDLEGEIESLWREVTK